VPALPGPRQPATSARYRPLVGLGAALKPGRTGCIAAGLAPGLGLGDAMGSGELAAGGEGLTATAGESGGRVGWLPPVWISGGTTDVAGTTWGVAWGGAVHAATTHTITSGTPIRPFARSRLPCIGVRAVGPPARRAARI
jgi:hypothetical protein